MAHPRLAPIEPRKAGWGPRLFVAFVNKIGGLEASNVFLTLMHNMRLFRAWLGFASKLMPYGELERRDSELIILRVAWNCRSRYEWGQHVDIGLRAGLSIEEIYRVPQGHCHPDWEPRQRALLQSCDELHHERIVSDATWLELSRHYEPRKIVEVLMLIGHYGMLAGLLNSAGTILEAGVEAVLAKVQPPAKD